MAKRLPGASWVPCTCSTSRDGSEAAMFSAQLAGPDKVKAGMNHEIAKENYQLLLNIIHWLDEKIQ